MDELHDALCFLVGATAAVALYCAVYFGLSYLSRRRDNNAPLPPRRHIGALVAGSILFFGGLANYAAHHFDEGLPVAKAKKPSKADLAHLEGEIQEGWRTRNYPRVLSACDRLSAAAPKSGLAHHARGLCYETEGKMEEAKAEYLIAAGHKYVPAVARLKRFDQ